MKKITGIVLLICLLLGTGCISFASGEAEYPWIYEVFDNSSMGKVKTDGANLSVSSGALKVRVGSNIMNGGGGYKIGAQLENGKKYKLSFLIKLEDGANIPRQGSKNNSYNSAGDISKLYGKIKEGSSVKQTLDFGEATYWSNAAFVKVEQEFTYEGTGGEVNISLRVGENTDMGGKNLQGEAALIYYLDEITLIPTAENALIENLACDYVEDESNMMKMSYDFLGTTTDNSLSVLMTENNDSWKFNKILCVGESEHKFQIPTSLNGKKCKVVVYPADGTNPGAVCETVIEQLNLNIVQSVNIADDTITAEVKLCYPSLKKIIVFICQYNDENEMLDIDYEAVECDENIVKTVTLTPDVNEDMQKTRLFVWEGSDFKTSQMLSLVDEVVVEKE